jgi:WD40 repeat protein
MEVQKRFDLAGHDGSVYCLSTSGLPGIVLSGAAEGVVGAWNIVSGQPSALSIRTGSAVFSMAEHQGKLLLGLMNGHLHVIDIQRRVELRQLVRHSKTVYALVHAYGHWYSGGGDGVINQWSADFDLLRSVRLSHKKIRAIAPIPDTGELAVACGDGRIYLLDGATLSDGGFLQHHDGGVNALCYSGGTLISGGWDGHFYVWTDRTLQQRLPVHNFAIYAIVAQPGGHILASASRDKTIKLWDRQTFAPLGRLDHAEHGGHRLSVNTLLWADGSTLVSSGDDRRVLVWEVR